MCPVVMSAQDLVESGVIFEQIRGESGPSFEINQPNIFQYSMVSL